MQLLKVKKETYPWGSLIIISEGVSWSAILHPKDVDSINVLQVGESVTIQDETRSKWLFTRNDDTFHIKGVSEGDNNTCEGIFRSSMLTPGTVDFMKSV
jgi:hypothetical protein